MLFYTINMKKTTIIAGKDFPAGNTYSNIALENERDVIITTTPGVQTDTSILKADSIAWNRSSPISARTVMMKAENKYKKLDELLLIFDGPFFAAQYVSNDIEGFSRTIDDLILGYCYLAAEAAAKYEKQGFGRLVFILKYTGTGANPIKSAADLHPASIPLAIAQDAFIALAENFAARFEASKQVFTTLVRADTNTDNETASWLFPFLSEIQVRRTSGWLKVGTKPGGVFSFLKN